MLNLPLVAFDLFEEFDLIVSILIYKALFVLNNYLLKFGLLLQLSITINNRKIDLISIQIAYTLKKELKEILVLNDEVNILKNLKRKCQKPKLI